MAGQAMTGAGGLERRLAELDAVGVSEAGVNRLAWTEEDAQCRAWFVRQAESIGCAASRDPAGNLWACPAQPPPWWGIGSHLDSVRAGGRYDGPLGVACGFEIAAASARPVAVISFADEEGARFNTPTFGSKALAGALELPAALERRDERGVRLADAMREAGVPPEGLPQAPAWLERLNGFIEIHIDQSTEIARAGQPAGIVSALAGRMRLQAELRGRADHAGATPAAERRDALSAAAHLIVTAEALAAEHSGLTVSTSRILAEPNAPTTIASSVRLWIDARAPDLGGVQGWRQALADAGAALTTSTGVEISIEVVSRSPGREFSRPLRRRLAEASVAVLGRPVPEMVCFAGHDAGVLAARIPAAMVLVRNRSGISHAPVEAVELKDGARAAQIVQRTLEAMP
jgi:N-carbamoyl-L-amino-acid hydrolase